MNRSFVAALLLVLSQGALSGQEAQRVEEAREEARDRLDEIFEEVPPEPIEVPAPNFPLAPDPVAVDDETQNAYFESLRNFYRYRQDGYRHRNRVFQWQLVSSVIIFFLVVALVVIGVYFAWLQFRYQIEKGFEAEATKLELSGASLKVSSSVLGVIILSLSLAFFYLYLRHVYPIQNVF